MSDLQDAIDGKVPEVANPVITEEVAEALKAEPAVEEESTPTVEVAEEDQKVEEVAKVDDVPEIAAFKAKAIDETQKRQALASQLEQANARLAALEEPAEKVNFWDNPDEAIGGVEASTDRKIQVAKTDMSVMMMRSIKPDYDEKEAVFVDLVMKNPALAAQMNQSVNPAEFAYSYAKNYMDMQEIGDIDAFKADIEAKAYAKAKAEFEGGKKAEIEAAIKTRSELPGSLSNERAAGGNQNAVYTTPTLETIIGN